jgi:NAD(P)-dependent dehydrogenase (short-subunit alcohol dehydrogenase family)
MADIDTRTLFNAIRPRYPEFDGQAAIVTGSSRGIGKGIALRLAKEGMRVVINGLDEARVAEAVGEMKAVGIEALGVPSDVGTTGGVEKLVGETMRAFGRVDVVVNNAADLRRVPFLEVDEAMLDNQLAANIRGPFLLSARTAEIMKANGGGNIIHISSVGGLQAHWPGLPYDMTKGALDSMTQAMALDLAEYGIRVNAIAPGATATERTPDLEDPRIQAVSKRIPLLRFGLAEEIGAAVAFLVSPDAGYITGQIIYVDGGLTAQLSPRESRV